MPRTLDDMLASLPPDQLAEIEARYQEMLREIEGLRELRRIAGKAQADIARALELEQPSISKLEHQADMYISTLRDYVEALNGRLDIVVTLPGHPPLRLYGLGDLREPDPDIEEPPTGAPPRMTTA